MRVHLVGNYRIRGMSRMYLDMVCPWRNGHPIACVSTRNIQEASLKKLGRFESFLLDMCSAYRIPNF